MEKFTITPMTAPPGSDDYLPCDEQHATHWGVVIDENTKVLYETRHDAEEGAKRLFVKYLADRADRFVWRDGDVEHL